MLVTVALPVFNGARFLGDALASILAQSGVELEVVASDDGSTDTSLEILSRANDQRVRVLRNDTNLGIFGNLNRCLSQARGDLIQVFSQDDVMHPGYLASQAAHLARYPSAGLVYGRPQFIDANGGVNPPTVEDRTPEFIDWPLYLWIASHFGALPASISSIMFPRRTIETVGMFDPSFLVAGDLEFYNRVAERYPIVLNSDVLHAVRGHARATSALSSAGARYLAEEARLAHWFRSHWSADDYRKVVRFQSAWRGRYHLGWIGRTALRGQPLTALKALWLLHKVYPLPHVLSWRLRFLVDRDLRPTPDIPPPAC